MVRQADQLPPSTVDGIAGQRLQHEVVVALLIEHELWVAITQPNLSQHVA